VRRSRTITLARVIGALGMLGLTALLFWLLTDPSFRITASEVTFVGLVHADEAAVRSHLSGIDRGPNVFRVRAADLVRDVSQLPDVDAASASVTLPADITVRLEERQPLFVWDGGDVAWLVDEEGMLFGPTDRVAADASAPATDAPAADSEAVATAVADTDAAQPTAAETDAAGATIVDVVAAIDDDARAGLPVVSDKRLPAERPTIGSHLSAVDLEVMRHLLAITPEMLGSRTQGLDLRVDENLGYVLFSDAGWYAVFGHYSPLIQPPDKIPQQVQCLRAALARDERNLQRVRLSVSGDLCGTFVESE
jgi:hypothetical protein